MASSNSPCAACKIQRRKCTQECVFAPYFPPDQPQKFCNVHKVFGASNVSKLLQELNASQREDAVNSLAYEADARLRDPVYGCVGLISVLQHKLRQVQTDLITAKKELATYLGPHAAAATNNMMVPILPPPTPVPAAASYHPHPQHHQQFLSINSNNNNNPSSSTSPLFPPYVQPLMAIPKAAGAAVASSSHSHPGHEILEQQIYEAQQQFAAAAFAARDQELLSISLEQKLHHHQPQEDLFVRVINSSGFDAAAAAINVGGGGSTTTSNIISPTLALGTFDDSSYHVNQPHQSEHHHHHFHPHLIREQLMLGQAPDRPEQAQQQVHRQLQMAQMREENKSAGPSS